MVMANTSSEAIPSRHLDPERADSQRVSMETRASQLDDPDYAAFAWGRYKKLMWWMASAAAVTTIGALVILRLTIGELPWLIALFTAGGIFVSVLLCAALMGLVFLSSGSGHDDAIVDPMEDLYP
jgi:hypothetical protein